MARFQLRSSVSPAQIKKLLTVASMPSALRSIMRAIRHGLMKTKSEEVFESFLTLKNLPFEKIEEVPERGAHRPDYLVTVGNSKVIFEVKQLAEDEDYGVVTDPKYPHIKSFTRTVGDHVRRLIDRSKKQIQYGASLGIPSVLLIYNSLDQAFQDFGTEDHDFIAAMYGEYTVQIDTRTQKSSEMFNGQKSSLRQHKNTSFSAVGRLTDRCREIDGEVVTDLAVTLFENAFARVTMPYDHLPQCFDVRRSDVSREPLSFA